jgi:hypothetical protein
MSAIPRTVIFLLMGMCLSSCSSGSNGSSSPSSYASTSTKPSAPAQASTPAKRSAATIESTSSGGDELLAEVRIGDHARLADVPEIVSVARECQSSPMPARSIAIPVTVTLTLRSNLQLQVNNSISAASRDESRGLYASILRKMPSGYNCSTDSLVRMDQVELIHGASETIEYWLVLPGAITASSPRGDFGTGGVQMAVLQQTKQRVYGPLVCDAKEMQILGIAPENKGCGKHLTPESAAS